MGKHMASLKMLQVKPTCLPSMETAARRSKLKTLDDIRVKTQRLKQKREESRPDVLLHGKLKLEIDHIIAKCDLLWANWRMDGVPLQDHSLAHVMAKSLARAVGLGDGLVPKGGMRNKGNVTTLREDEVAGLEALRKVGDELETAAAEIIRAADSKATRFPGILRRLLKKCARELEVKDWHRLWWEDLLVHRPPELQKTLKGSLAGDLKEHQRMLGEG
jgi:hypothetical protein